MFSNVKSNGVEVDASFSSESSIFETFLYFSTNFVCINEIPFGGRENVTSINALTYNESSSGRVKQLLLRLILMTN